MSQTQMTGHRRGSVRVAALLALACAVSVVVVGALTGGRGVRPAGAVSSSYAYSCDNDGDIVGMFSFTPSPAAAGFDVFITYHVPGGAQFQPLPGGGQSFPAGSISPVAFNLDASALPAEANAIRIESSITNEKSASFLCGELPESSPTPTSTATAVSETKTPGVTRTVSGTTTAPAGTSTVGTTTTATVESKTATPTSTATQTETQEGTVTSTPTASTTAGVLVHTPTATGTASPHAGASASPSATRTVAVLPAAVTATSSPSAANALPNTGGRLSGRRIMLLVVALAAIGALFAATAAAISREDRAR